MGNHNSAGPGERPSSYSQLSTYAECPKRWQLTYEQRAPRRPGVWFPAGTAVHESIRRYLIQTLEGNHDKQDRKPAEDGTSSSS